ncbi:MAG: RNA polymerase sigma factor [Fimbriimonadaceae bacterium]|nr:RNA polymerase sigma factor [Fimbriimonadaceae bacterium]
MSETFESSLGAGVQARPTMADLVRDHYDAVYRFCVRRVGIDWASDAAQDTFLTAQRVYRNFRFESSVRTFLLGIANNECRTILRKRGSLHVQLQFVESNVSSECPEAQWINRRVLSNALASLSDEHREVVILHEMEGLKYEEIAQVVGVPLGTVKSRLFHAFANLRAQLRGSESTQSGTESAEGKA